MHLQWNYCSIKNKETSIQLMNFALKTNQEQEKRQYFKFIICS